MDAKTIASLPPKLLAQYLRDPSLQMAVQMQQEGSDTSPVQHWTQGAARLAKGLLGGMQSRQIQDQYNSQADSAANERRMAYAKAFGKPAQTETIGDRTINWNAQAPNLMGAAANLSAPDNQDLAGTFIGAKFTQDQTAASQAFTQAQQERAFQQQEAMQGRLFGQQAALSNAQLDRQLALEQWKINNDPMKQFIAQYVGGQGGAPAAADAKPLRLAGNELQGVSATQAQGGGRQLGLAGDNLQGTSALGAQGGGRPLQLGGSAAQGVQLDMTQAQATGQPAQPSMQDVIFSGALSKTFGDPPEGMMYGRNGLVPNPNAKISDAQAQAAAYYRRLQASNQIIGEPKVTAAMQSAGQIAASNVPFVGNALVSDDFQSGDQAQRDFINSVLRRESGAVISPSEFANARQQYFPQYGDSAATLAQKAQNRITTGVGLLGATGPAGRGLPPMQQATPAPQAPQGMQEGTEIINPQTGETLILRGGQWVPQ